MGRLQRDEKTWWETTGSFLAKPIMVAICLGFILVFNAVILFRQDSGDDVSYNTPTADVADNENIVASNSSFDYENLDQQ